MTEGQEPPPADDQGEDVDFDSLSVPERSASGEIEDLPAPPQPEDPTVEAPLLPDSDGAYPEPDLMIPPDPELPVIGGDSFDGVTLFTENAGPADVDGRVEPADVSDALSEDDDGMIRAQVGTDRIDADSDPVVPTIGRSTSRPASAALEAHDADDADDDRYRTVRQQIQSLVEDSLGAAFQEVALGDRERLLEQLVDHVLPLEETSFGIEYLVHTIARFIERTAPPVSEGAVDQTAQRIEAARHLVHLSAEDSREAMAQATNHLKTVIRDIEGLRSRVHLLEDTNASAYSALNLNEHEFAILRTRYERILAAIARCAEQRDEPSRAVLQNRQADALERVTAAENVLFSLLGQGGGDPADGERLVAAEAELVALRSQLAASDEALVEARESATVEAQRCQELTAALTTAREEADERERALREELGSSENDLQQEIDRLRAERDGARSEIDAVFDAQRRVAEQLAAQEALTAEQTERVVSLEEELRQTSERLDVINGQQGEALLERDAAVADRDAAQAELARLGGELMAARAALGDAAAAEQERIAALETSCQQLRDEAAEQAAAWEAERASLQEGSQTLAEQQMALEAALDQARAALVEAEERLAQSEAAQAEALADREHRLSETEDRCRALQATVETNEAEARSIQERLEASDRQATISGEEAAQVAADRERLERELAEAQERVAVLETEAGALEGLRVACGEAEQAAASQSERVAALQAELRELRGQLEEQSAAAESENERARELERQLARIDEEAASLRSQTESWDRQQDELSQRRQALEEQAHDIARREAALAEEQTRLEEERSLVAQERASGDQRAAALEEQAATQEERATSLAQEQQALADARQAAEDERRVLDQRAQDLATQEDSHSGTTAELEAERERLQALATAHGEQLQESLGRIGELETTLSHLRQESEETRSALGQQIESVEEERLVADRHHEEERLAWEGERETLIEAHTRAETVRNEALASVTTMAEAMLGDAEGLAAACDGVASSLEAGSADDLLERLAAGAGDLRAGMATLQRLLDDDGGAAQGEALGEACRWITDGGAAAHGVLVETVRRLGDRDRALHERDEEIEDLRRRLDAVGEALAAEEERSAAAAARAEASEQQRAARDHECTSLQAQAAALGRELDDLRQALADAEDRNHQATAAFEERIAALDGELERLHGEQTSDRARLETVTAAGDTAARSARQLATVARGLGEALALCADAQEVAKRGGDERITLVREVARLTRSLPESVAAATAPPAEDVVADLVGGGTSLVRLVLEQRAQAIAEGGRLAAALAELESRHAALDEAHQSQESALTETQGHLDALRQECAGLHGDLAVAERQAGERGHELAALKQTHAGTVADLEAAGQRIDQLTTEIAALREQVATIDGLRSRGDQMERRNQAAEGGLRTLLTAVREMAGDAGGMMDSLGLLSPGASKRLTRSSQRLAQAAKEGDPLAAVEVGDQLCDLIAKQVAAAHEEIRSVRDERLRHQDRIAVLEQDLRHRQEALDGAQEMAREQQRQIEDLTGRLAEIEQLRQELAAVRQAGAAAEKAHQQALRQAAAEREEQHAVAEEHHRALAEDRDQLQVACQESAERAEALQEQVDRLSGHLEAAEAEARQRMLALEEAVAERDDRLEGARREADRLRKERVEQVGLQSRIETLNGKLAVANRELVRQRAALDASGSASGRAAADAEALKEARTRKAALSRQVARLERLVQQEQARIESLHRTAQQQQQQWEQRLATSEDQRRAGEEGLQQARNEIRGLRKDLAGMKARLRTITGSA